VDVILHGVNSCDQLLTLHLLFNGHVLVTKLDVDGVIKPVVFKLNVADLSIILLIFVC